MRLTPEAWPGALQIVARLVGPEAAAAVARTMGGRRHYLPAVPGREHALARIIGLQGARLVAALLVGERGDHVDWPSARTQMNFMDAAALRDAGHSEAAIARKLNISARQVRRLVAHLPKGTGAPASDEAVERVCPTCGHRHRVRAAMPDTRQLPLPLA